MTKKERETIDTTFNAIRQKFESVMQPRSPYSESGYASPEDQRQWDAFFLGYINAIQDFSATQSIILSIAQEQEKDN